LLVEVWRTCFCRRALSSNSETNVKVHTPLPATASDETEVKP
jgi:hypothetical protein